MEVVYTILHAGGKFGGGGYKVSGGLHGVGASVVNALSSWLEVTVKQGGGVWRIRFENGGKTKEKLHQIGTCPKEETGTSVTFLPDPTIFQETTIFDYSIILQRLREMAFLTKGLRISLKDLRVNDPTVPGGEISEVRENVFHYEGGIREYVKYLNKNKTPLYPDILYFDGTKNNVYVEVAMQHNDAYNVNEYSFVNNINTPEGGMHLTGFHNALTKTFNDYARKNGILKDSDQNLSGDDIREGLTAIISVKVEDPQFEGQTKQKLGSARRHSSPQGQGRRHGRRGISPGERRRSRPCPCPENLRTARTRIRRTARSSSLRETPQAARQRAQETALPRRFCRCAARS